MISQKIKYLKCYEYLRQNINVFIEAFVEYYGEEKRKEIEEKFSNMLVIAYNSPKARERLLYDIKEEKSKEIQQKVLEGTDLDEYSVFKSMILDNLDSTPIIKFKNFYELYTLSEEERKNKFIEDGKKQILKILPHFEEEDHAYILKNRQIPSRLINIPNWIKNTILYYTDEKNAEEKYKKMFAECESLLKKYYPDITLGTFSNYLDDKYMKQIIDVSYMISERILEYEEFKEVFSEDEKNVNIDNKRNYTLKFEYYKKFIQENIDLIPYDKRIGLESYFEDQSQKYKIDDYVEFIFGYFFPSDSPLEAFSKKADEILDSDEPEWIKNQIKKNRVNYFIKNGLDLGPEYDLYKDNEAAKKIWPSKDRVEKFIESKNILTNKYNIEYYTLTKEHQKIRKMIEEKNLLDKKDGFDASLYTRTSGTFVIPNLIDTDKGYKIFALVGICCDTPQDCTDHYIVHELNHIYELYLSKVDAQSYEYLSGWDSIEGTITTNDYEVDTLNHDDDKRKYELFNEIINERIAQEISSIMHKNNKYVFDNKETSKYQNTTGYDSSNFLVEDFFNEYKDKIIESRRNGNINIIIDEVGKENFEELNNLFQIFYKHFAGAKLYGLLDDLKNNQQTKEVEIYTDLINKRDIILKKMREYKNHKNNHK